MKILVIEDDEKIVSILSRGFKEAHITIDIAMNGIDGEYMAESTHYDVIVLDWMLPEKDGLEVLFSLRDKGVKTPIIMLTAKSDIDDRVTGLDNGADDYLAKPFSFRELLSRVKALNRRAVSDGANHIKIQDIVVNLESRTVTKNDKPVMLTSQEYDLFTFLIKHHNSYVPKYMIEEQLWDNEVYRMSNVIQVTVYNLRKKLGKSVIKSFRGLGYKVEI